MCTKFKYLLFVFSGIVGFDANAQTNPVSQAVIIIVGDPIQSNNATDYINSNAGTESNAPPINQKIIQPNQNNIEPTLENGFHARFEIDSEYINHGGFVSASSSFPSTSITSDASIYSKNKRHAPSITERSFNTKKRIKSWFPKRKKKYRPHLCGRF